MKRIILLLAMLTSVCFAQFKASNEWYEIRIDQIAFQVTENFHALNLGDSFTISWDHVTPVDTTGTWYPNIGASYVIQVINSPGLWINNRLPYTINTSNVNGSPMVPGSYQVRVRTWGKKIVNGMTQDYATPYTESVYFLSIEPPQAPGNMRRE